MEYPPPPIILCMQYLMGKITEKQFSRLIKLWEEKHKAEQNDKGVNVS